MPQVITRFGKDWLRDVTCHVANRTHTRQSSPDYVESRLRDIEHRDIAVSAFDQVIHQRGCSSTDVDYRNGAIPACGEFDQVERRIKMRPIPAHLVGKLASIDLLPMFLHVIRLLFLSSPRCGMNYLHHASTETEPV